MPRTVLLFSTYLYIDLASYLETATRIKGPGPGRQVSRSCDQSVARVDGGAIVGIKVLGRDEDQGVDTLPVSLKGPDADELLLALHHLGRVEEPGLGSLVVGGRENEVPGDNDPGQKRNRNCFMPPVFTCVGKYIYWSVF